MSTPRQFFRKIFIFLYRYWISQAHDQNEFGTTVRAHEEANRLLIAPGCPDEPIVL
jgi:hypothetical protein